jgi:3-hydroxyacyl-CoA dehydrogenase/enoyl-CoA hydratase/3-hydroxybutyryl-CoA epimerase
LGIVHEIAPPGEVVQAAKAWVKTKGDALQPWEKSGFVIPGGGLDAEGGLALQRASAEIDKKYHGNYPAYLNILKCVSEGVQLPIDAALRIESWCMVRTVNSRQAKAMLRTLFLSQQAVSKGLGRPAGLPKSELKKVVLVGPGKIGAGLALEQASAGIETVLLAAADAIPALRKLLQDEGAKLRLTDEKLLQLMARITLGPNPALAHGSDLVIHGVPEAAIAPGSEIFADAAQVRLVSGRPDFDAGRPAGFHATLNFMQPRMAPVEVIKGDRMTDPYLAKIVDYIVKLRKVPIVVSDVAGGYVWRIARAYADEGQRMLAEGISPILVENAGISASMAKGPLGAAEWQPAGAMPVTEADGLALIDELRSRLLFRQSIEAVRCTEDGTVADARIADVGAILGCGFASWTGGPLSYVDMLGVRNFVQRCNDLSEKYGSRFAPPQLVLQMQAAGKSFY